MKLYDGGRAPNPRRVTVFLAEKGIEIERVPVDMGSLGHKSAEVTDLNPLQRLPVLVLDDGTPLSESVAICRYLEELYPEPPLMGINARDRAIVEMWNRRVELHLLASVAAAFRHTHPAMKEWEVPQVAEWGEANRPKALAFLELLDKELASREFIAGDRYTIADITAMIAVDFMKPARIDRPEHLENLMRWYRAVSSRPSAQSA
jgi:glutathione S-transferase